MSNRPLFITGNGTGIGKTIVSAIVVEKLKADYWKPVQCGDLENSDTLKVSALVSNPVSVFHEEAYTLKGPYSPHKAADLEGVRIDPAKITLPDTNNRLVIEGAGGLMVPLNNEFLMIDLIRQLNAEVIVVLSTYLGSINHSLLTITTLQKAGLPIKGLIFNGETDPYTEDIILDYTNVTLLGHVSQMKQPEPAAIIEAGKSLKLF